MLTFTNDQLREKLHDELGVDASGIDFLPFSDVAQSVRDDLATLRASALLPKEIPVRGFIYDVTDGALTEVA
jgi:carbonic anhydrase